jgi:hypothetical protein
MPIGLVMCAIALPVPVMLFTEVALAVAAAYLLSAVGQRYSVMRVPVHP